MDIKNKLEVDDEVDDLAEATVKDFFHDIRNKCRTIDKAADRVCFFSQVSLNIFSYFIFSTLINKDLDFDKTRKSIINYVEKILSDNHGKERQDTLAEIMEHYLEVNFSEHISNCRQDK